MRWLQSDYVQDPLLALSISSANGPQYRLHREGIKNEMWHVRPQPTVLLLDEEESVNLLRTCIVAIQDVTCEHVVDGKRSEP